MTNATQNNMSLNELTTQVTAFPSWEKFESAMSNNGYCPTLRTMGGRSKAAKRQDELTDELASRLASMGYPVFFNGKTI